MAASQAFIVRSVQDVGAQSEAHKQEDARKGHIDVLVHMMTDLC